jgi:hypothetical protein
MQFWISGLISLVGSFQYLFPGKLFSEKLWILSMSFLGFLTSNSQLIATARCGHWVLQEVRVNQREARGQVLLMLSI